MTKLKLSSLLFLVTLIAISLGSCTYQNEEELFGKSNCDPVSQVSLQQDVFPILNTNCYSCHSAGVATAGINLENYNSLLGIADSGKLVGTLKHQSGYASMPPGGNKLNDCDILVIETWITEGAKNN